MDVYRPLRAALFFYEIFRVLLLVVFLFIGPQEAVDGTFFPYLVYLSANALFPLMTLFVWLRPQEYRNYLTLYMAGKFIGMAAFFAWEFFSSRQFPGAENIVRSMVLLGGSVFISLADMLSISGAWALSKKYRSGGV